MTCAGAQLAAPALHALAQQVAPSNDTQNALYTLFLRSPWPLLSILGGLLARHRQHPGPHVTTLAAASALVALGTPGLMYFQLIPCRCRAFLQHCMYFLASFVSHRPSRYPAGVGACHAAADEPPFADRGDVVAARRGTWPLQSRPQGSDYSGELKS